MQLDCSALLKISLAANLVLVAYVVFLHLSPAPPLSQQVEDLRKLNVATWNEIERIREVSK